MAIRILGYYQNIIIDVQDEDPVIDDNFVSLVYSAYYQHPVITNITTIIPQYLILSDDILLGESVVFSVTKNFQESIQVNEALSKTFTKVFSENISVSETLTLGIGKNFQESISATETISKSITKPFNEDITMGDNGIARLYNSNSVVIGDVVLNSVPLNGNQTKQVYII